MKRLVSLVLTLALALSLTVPALTVPALAAEDGNPPLWQEYGFTSREECVREWFGGDEAAYQAEADALLERQRWEAGMAGEIAAFDADAYWDSDECWQRWVYGSKESFMEAWELKSQEDFRQCVLESWLDDQWEAYEEATLVERTLRDMGGVPGQVGVMLDGTYISFTGGDLPEVREGRTMVPCGPVLKAFGGTVGHDGEDVVYTQEGRTLRFRAGGDTVAVTGADGTEEVIRLDVPCYVKNGATYIPVRFFAEAMGCDVLWDSVFHTAVLLRRDRIVETLDSQFTVLNRMLSAMERDASKNYKTVVKMDAQMTLLDSINGDKSYGANADLELLQSGSVWNLTAKMDLSALLEIPELVEELTPLELLTARSILRNMACKVIYDGEGGMLYVQLPAMSLLTGGAVDKNGWMAMPVITLETVEARGAVTVGAMLYDTMAAAAWDSGYYYDGKATPARLYRELMDTAGQMAAFLGDGCFQESGGYSVLRYDEAAYNDALEQEYGEGAAEYFGEFEKLELELKVARSGSATFKAVVQNKAGYWDDPVILLDVSGSLSAAKMDMKLLLKVKNQLDLTLRYTAATTATREQPLTAPPAGEPVTSLDEGIYGEEDLLPDILPEEAAAA